MKESFQILIVINNFEGLFLRLETDSTYEKKSGLKKHT